MSFLPTTLIAFLGGLVPALVWLWFWLKEDKKNPEPRILITIAFIAGAVCVPLAIFLEKEALIFISGATFSVTPLVLVFWAIIEEMLKLTAGFFVVLRRKEVDEPIDAIIYMITIALGFAALENTLFIFNGVGSGVLDTFTTGSFRFMGATLLHILSSAALGVAIGLSFYKTRIKKIFYFTIGAILSITIHAAFNIFIDSFSGEHILKVFSFVWAGIIILILFFEKVRSIKKKKKIQKNIK